MHIFENGRYKKDLFKKFNNKNIKFINKIVTNVNYKDGYVRTNKSKNSYDYSSFKFKIFSIGILYLVISEISLNFTGTNNVYNLIFLFFPIISFLLIYQIVKYKLEVNK